jgi:hypothetical protein
VLGASASKVFVCESPGRKYADALPRPQSLKVTVAGDDNGRRGGEGASQELVVVGVA